MSRVLTAVCLIVVTCQADAAIVAILNATDATVKADVSHDGANKVTIEWLPGQCRGVPVGRASQLVWQTPALTQRYQLDPYMPYVLISPKSGEWQFSGVQLTGALPKPSDVSAKPSMTQLEPVPVQLHGDTSSKISVEGWSKTFGARVASVGEALESQTGLRLKVTASSEWTAQLDAEDIDAVLAYFEREVKPKDNELAIGFVSGAVPGKDLFPRLLPNTRHILVREATPRTEEQRVEILAHQLATVYGAVPSPDAGSFMRATVGTGNTPKHLQLDPLNMIVVHIWAEERSAGRGPKPEQFNAKSRHRLRVLYETMAELHETLKTDELVARNRADLLAKLPVDPEDETQPQPNPEPGTRPAAVVEPGLKQDGEAEAIAAVVKAITERAKKFQTEAKQPTSDELTVAYLTAAAIEAEKYDKPLRQRAFLIGIGIGLDDSTILRDKPFLKELFQKAEPDADRRERLKVLGSPSIQGRRDWCQHFALSAALTELVGSQAAEFAGLAKELADMKGTSGFSFADLGADYAGIAFAGWIRAESGGTAIVAEAFKFEEYVPVLKNYPENINEAEFKKTYGTATDQRCVFQMQLLEADIRKLKPYSGK